MIGVLWQGVDSDPNFPASYGDLYIPASYVKWVEAAGAQVVPFDFNRTDAEIEKAFSSLNGILFPGGDYDLVGSRYFEVTALLTRLVMEANDRGEYVPSWNTCQGFEALALITSRNDSVLSSFSAENLGLALNFTASAPASRMFGSLSPASYATLASRPATANLHMYGLSPETYAASPELSSFYDVLSTSNDRNGRTFVSAMEARRYPIYGTQFHPERNANEWGDPNEPVDHSPAAVAAMQELAAFFVTEARRNSRAFPSRKAEGEALIYSVPGPRHTTDVNPSYVQTYFV